MLTEDFIKAQLEAARLLQEHFLEIKEIAEKYGGTELRIHDSVQVNVPEQNMQAFLKEAVMINSNLRRKP